MASADYAHPHFRHHPHSAQSTPSLLGLSPLTNFRDLALDEPYSRPSYPGAGNSPYSQLGSLGFDSSRPAHPSSMAMERALDLFQENFEQEDGGRFLWLHAEALRHTWRERALPAPVANCIAALSLRFASNSPSFRFMIVSCSCGFFSLFLRFEVLWDIWCGCGSAPVKRAADPFGGPADLPHLDIRGVRLL